MNPELTSDELVRWRLSAIVDSSDDAIISKDLNGIITSWNRGAERTFGYVAEEIIGRPISLLAAPDRINEMPSILARIRRGERVEHYETFRKRKDGRVIAVSLTISPLRDHSGTIVGASKIARDITDQKRAEEALRQANAQLRRANRELEQFAYSASHDLQEPLRMVSIYSQLLQKRLAGTLDADAQQYLTYAMQGAERMQILVRDLLTYTHATNLSDQSAQPTHATAALQRAIENLQSSIAETGASIAHTPLPIVTVHEVHLRQLFQNLIGNAIKYRSLEPPRIEISAIRQQNEWVFCVKDNGIGIAPQYQKQIFELFKRLHSAADYQGTGIGLALCQRIVEKYGGRIWVESEEGAGATFLFALPDSPEENHSQLG
jgi:PAS domain S-box-containing protein